MSDIILYDYWRSSASYRVRIALALKGIAYRRVPIDLAAGAQRDAEFTALNPARMVPALVSDGLVLTQSLAIINYLDALYPAPPLWPSDAVARARVEARVLTLAADTHPVQNLRVLNYLTAQFGADAAARAAFAREWIASGFATLEAGLGVGDEAYLTGAEVGIADIVLVPQFANARRFDLDLTPYPRLVAIDARAAAVPAFGAAHPDRLAP